MHTIGLDLGGTKLASAVFSESGEILYRNTLQVTGKKGAEVGGIIRHEIAAILANDSLNIRAVGICVPGIFYAREGTVWAPNIDGWDRYPLIEELTAAVGNKEIKVAVDSDRACYILGETWLGAARGCSDAVFLAVGTGIGAGIMVDGKILRGYGDIAGAVGWLGMNRPFRTEYSACGAFEYYASGEGIARTASEFIRADVSYDGMLAGRKYPDLSAREIFEAYERGDVIAVKAFGECIALWGMAAGNLVSVLNPEKIIFGGGVFGPAVAFLKNIRIEAGKWAQPFSMQQVSFEASSLGGDAGLYGAGRLAFNLLE